MKYIIPLLVSFVLSSCYNSFSTIDSEKFLESGNYHNIVWNSDEIFIFRVIETPSIKIEENGEEYYAEIPFRKFRQLHDKRDVPNVVEEVYMYLEGVSDQSRTEGVVLYMSTKVFADEKFLKAMFNTANQQYISTYAIREVNFGTWKLNDDCELYLILESSKTRDYDLLGYYEGIRGDDAADRIVITHAKHPKARPSGFRDAADLDIEIKDVFNLDNEEGLIFWQNKNPGRVLAEFKKPRTYMLNKRGKTLEDLHSQEEIFSRLFLDLDAKRKYQLGWYNEASEEVLRYKYSVH